MPATVPRLRHTASQNINYREQDQTGEQDLGALKLQMIFSSHQSSCWMSSITSVL